MTPQFLSIDEVLELHVMQLARFGGQAGLRDRALLESALAMPSSGFGGEFLHTTPAEMAAAYLFYLNRNHPFFDGNKRTATMAAIVFLELNGLPINVTDLQLTEISLAVASGRADKQAVVAFFRENLPPEAVKDVP